MICYYTSTTFLSSPGEAILFQIVNSRIIKNTYYSIHKVFTTFSFKLSTC